MVERGPNLERNFEAPATGEGQPYVAPAEQVGDTQEIAPAPSAEPAPAQPAEQILKDYNLEAIASGSEQPEIIDLQNIMQSHFEQENNDEDLPDAA